MKINITDGCASVYLMSTAAQSSFYNCFLLYYTHTESTLYTHIHRYINVLDNLISSLRPGSTITHRAHQFLLIKFKLPRTAGKIFLLPARLGTCTFMIFPLRRHGYIKIKFDEKSVLHLL